MGLADQYRCLRSLSLVLAISLPIACGPTVDSPGETLDQYFDAVQSQDLERLYCLTAGAQDAPELGATPDERRAAFEGWARGYYDAYEMGRDEGWVEIDDQGLALVKMLSLGRGAFVTHGRVERLAQNGVRLESRIRPAYSHIDLSRFPSGTTFYLCGAPLGRMHALQIPYESGELSADVLDSITLQWSLVRRERGHRCAGSWSVVGAVAVADSLKTTEVTWNF